MDCFVGEIRMFGGMFAPQGWARCDGSLLPIAEYDVLFNLLGTTYGGDGESTFGVPDLRGRAPIHVSPNNPAGQQGGVESVTLVAGQLAAHTHDLVATTGLAIAPTPGGNVPAQSGTVQLWTEDTAGSALAPDAIAPFPGGGQPHENMPPFLALTFIIALNGIYPSPS